MISFNKKDDKMSEIAKQSQISGAVTKEDYRVYGLRNENNAPILIEYSSNSDVYNEVYRKCCMLRTFFNRHGIALEHAEIEHEEDNTDYKIYIGIRRDIRNDAPLACAILKTIVYYLDDKLKIEDNSTVGVLPRFIVNGEN
jgi:hypothetical protein